MKLEPLDYHRRIADTLAANEKELWDWFGSDTFGHEYGRGLQLRLAKSALLLGRDSSPNNVLRYRLAETARERLSVDASIALFQSHNVGGAPNAMLYYIPGQITIEFSGRILELLDEDELLDLLGHEIAHYKLYQDEGGRHHTAVRLLHWICRRNGCPETWFETSRRLSLYTEVYCDIAGFLVTGKRDVSIRGLAKTIADFKDADASTYLSQVEAILAQDNSRSQGISHPELYIRAKAIANREVLDDRAFEASLVPLIEGPLHVEALDILGQESLQELTRALVDSFTKVKANQTDPVHVHARQYFPRYRWPAKGAVTSFVLSETTQQTLDYLSYVLLDFVLCDQERAEEALCTALALTRRWGLSAHFRRIARKELKRTADELEKFERHGQKVIEEATDA